MATETPASETQSTMTQTAIWVGLMFVVVAALAYFAA